MNRRRVLSLVGYTGLGAGAFALGLAWQRPELFHWHLDDEPSASSSTSTDSNFVMPNALAEFAYPDVHGEMHALSDWAGKHVLVNFWATWCGPCREEIPLLIAVQDQFADHLQVIGLALDRVEPTRLFGDEYGINYPSLIPGQDAGFSLLERFQPQSMLPFSLLVDPDRKVISSKLGAYEADELIAELTELIG